MNEIKVSVVIPVYNRADVIYTSIISVLEQNGDFPIEIIIVDDFSDDRIKLLKNVNKIIEEKSSDRFEIKVLLHEENKHGGAARNTGVRNSSGNIIAFLDSDDVWTKDKLLNCCKALASHDIDFVYHQLTYNNNEKIIPKLGVKNGQSFMDYLICCNGAMQTSTLVFKKEAFDIISFSEDLTKYQDFDLIYKCEQAGLKVAFIPQVMTIMDNNPNAIRISNSFDPSKSIYWLDKIKNNLSSNAKNTFIINRVVKYFCLNGQKIHAIKYMKKNMSLNITIRDMFYLGIYLFCPLFVINLVKKIKHAM